MINLEQRRQDARYVQALHENRDMIDTLTVTKWAVDRLTMNAVDVIKQCENDELPGIVAEMMAINRLLNELKHRSLDLYCSHYANKHFIKSEKYG